MKNTRITFRLPQELIDSLYDLSEATGETVSSIIRACIQHSLKDVKDTNYVKCISKEKNIQPDYLYRRQNNIINKAVRNDDFNAAFSEHYEEVADLAEANPEVFNDTYLALSASYDPNKAFAEQFASYFKKLQYEEYKLRKRMSKMEVEYNDDIEF